MAIPYLDFPEDPVDSLSNFDWAGLGLKVLAAVVILIVTAILAMLIKKGVAGLTQKVPALRRPGVDGAALGNSLGTIASMVVWLLGLIIILGIFELSQVLSPVVGMLEQGLGFIPNIIGAVFVFIIGLTIAKIVKALIVTALNAVDFGKLLGTAQSGFEKATGGVTSAGRPAAAQGAHQGAQAPAGQQGQQQAAGQGQPGQQNKQGSKLPDILGSVVFALIMIVVSIAALQILGIASISEPASAMLTGVFTAIPNIIAAVVLVGIGVLIARFVSGLFRPILEGSAVDTWLTKQDILPQGASATPTVLRIVEIAVVLFFAVMGAQALGFPQITAILTEILELGGNVLFGGAIIAAGFFIATIVGKVLRGTPGTIVKWAVIILFTAMGLQSMGVADSIIEMAFGALVIGAAAAAMLAFGLGGRDAAARQLAKFEKAQASKPAPATAPAASGPAASGPGTSGPAASGPGASGPAGSGPAPSSGPAVPPRPEV
ncbi:mechanosensitive ion channel [Brachybacterium sp. FME24]|uniref:mechanosensitive ion channel n=1 Tax=Brachybacterium sp. FME24 TaxID=2742605 RepID=UPI002714DC8B|nr:mechanosensitive ion channel [Brachybacterium sp. FME24]